MKKPFEVYEVSNPSFRDMNIEQQIDAGINDWVAKDQDGCEFFGQSKDQALAAANMFNGIRG